MATVVRTRANGLVVFLVLAFTLAWVGMIGAYALGFSLVSPLVQLPFAFAPALAAFIVRKWVTGEGFADAGLRLRLRAAWPQYLAAWLGPAALVAATAGVAVVFGVRLAPLDGQVGGLPGWALVAILLLVVPLLTPIYWGEEFGWTSYLRQRVCPGRPVAATVVTGLIWAVWHYPLAFVGYIEFDDVVVGLAVWTVSFLCQEVLLSWLRVRSGSVWTASLAHSGNNMMLSLLVGFLLADVSVIAVTVIMTIPMAVLSLWVLATGRLVAPVPASPGSSARAV
ncbi:CPBP family intramembrane glutamic endopeptidase [Kibdelosporangium phytohabitans]|uniref:Abortive infection protein n=1 Tax=Kibdelosporangium phytohabitans TaxID=860235 RepID=A0A0N9HRJ9_9PSEU|nr:CPBP family intramembrane glutamic endopeptidase [Kibdelosporangium phytohabitans]ALG09811.1 abortive infection protein [Kibdelosporangium phytohabitans]MBE1468801.1 membrane protease YdiL (CAAX protease family) [Kibdelosporangium phytohabitans]